MTSPSSPRTSRLYHGGRGTAFTPVGAIALVFAAGATLLTVGVALRSLGAQLYEAVAAGQLAMAALVMGITLRVQGGPGSLGLRRPPPQALVGCVLVGCTFWYINMRLVSLLPLPESATAPLQQLVSLPPLWLAIVTIAVVPAVCEELVFRGVLARSLRMHDTAGMHAFAVLGSALLFSGYHLSVVQAIPTFVLGLVFAHVALCSDSVFPTMVAHFLNNAIGVTIARGELPEATRAMESHPTVTLVSAIVVGVAGVALASRREVRRE